MRVLRITLYVGNRKADGQQPTSNGGEAEEKDLNSV